MSRAWAFPILKIQELGRYIRYAIQHFPRCLISSSPSQLLSQNLPPLLLFPFLASRPWLYNTNAPTSPITPITTHISFAPTTCCLPAAPVNGANGATLVACTLFVLSVRLGSELYVPPCATLTVVIVIAGRGCVVVEGFDVTLVEGEAALTMLAGGQLETPLLVANLTVEELEDDDAEGRAEAVEANDNEAMGTELGREKVLAYQTELGTGTRVIVTTETTEVEVVEIETEVVVGRVMVQVEVKVLDMKVELAESADQLTQVMLDADEELVPVLVLFGSAVELGRPKPVANPLQVLLVQVPNVDQPVGVEKVEEEEAPELELVDDEVVTPSTGVELELVLQALPQAQDEELALEPELELVDDEVVTPSTGVELELELQALPQGQDEELELELDVVETLLLVDEVDMPLTGVELELELEVTEVFGLEVGELELEEYEVVHVELLGEVVLEAVLEVILEVVLEVVLDVVLEVVLVVVLVIVLEVVVEVVLVVLDVVLELVIGRLQELLVNRGLITCA